MTLKSILTDSESDELGEKFKTEFLRPSFNLRTEIKSLPLTNNYTIVGIAFDYLMRFYLQHHNKNAFIEGDTWVADHAYEKLTKKLSTTNQKEIATGYNEIKFIKTKHLLKLITDQYKQTKSNYEKFVFSGKITDELIANTIFLAKLDGYYRVGVIDQNLDNHNPDDIKDIKTIISIANKENFIAKQKCYLNPRFGTGSSLVGGADADIIIDNTLIDIKVTKTLELKRKYLNQLLGYYVLSLIGGINDNPQDKPIENIGIYFARHGELWTVPLLYFGDKKKFERFKKWFISYIENEINITDRGAPVIFKMTNKKGKT